MIGLIKIKKKKVKEKKKDQIKMTEQKNMCLSSPARANLLQEYTGSNQKLKKKKKKKKRYPISKDDGEATTKW